MAFKSIASVVLWASVARAHMMMANPVPYGKSSLNNSPLNGDGSDFPCKQRTGVYDAEGASNVAAIGVPQTLSFIGGATHGGGSCQVSLTTDLQPTKDSKWMVIKSIIGGCPSSAPGNLNGDPASTAASTFQYTIPEGINPGEYTVAWTWFNHIGNREMYMNCGPMTVTAAKKKRYAPAPKSKRQSTFPDMYAANLDGNCHSIDSADLVFPDPGADVQTAGNGPFAAATCNAGKGGMGAAQQPTGAVPAASGAPSAPSAGGAAPTGFAGGNGQYSQAPSSPTSAPQVVPVSLTPSSATSAPKSSNTTPQVVPVTPAAAASTTPGVFAPSATPIAPAAGSASAGQQSGPCTNEGEWNCIGGTSFQRCASGAWSAVTPLNGMRCTPGETADFNMTPAKAKRSFTA